MGELIARLFGAAVLGTLGFIFLGPVGSVIGCIIGFLFTEDEYKRAARTPEPPPEPPPEVEHYENPYDFDDDGNAYYADEFPDRYDD